MRNHEGSGIYVLSTEQWEHFVKTMHTPREPSETMKQGALMMSKWKTAAQIAADAEYESWFADGYRHIGN